MLPGAAHTRSLPAPSTCSGGRWTCQEVPCPGTCSVLGGSHFSTFDERQYTVHGDCSYVLAKVRARGPRSGQSSCPPWEPLPRLHLGPLQLLVPAPWGFLDDGAKWGAGGRRDLWAEYEDLCLQPCDSSAFTVLAELRRCGLTDSETCLKSLTLSLDGGHTVRTDPAGGLGGHMVRADPRGAGGHTVGADPGGGWRESTQ